MSWGNSEDGNDYDAAALAAASAQAPIDLVAEFGCPAHLLDITLDDEGVPGELVILTNARGVANAERADRSDRDGQERTFAIHRSGPFIMNTRAIHGATGIALIRAQAPFRSEAP